MIVLAKRNDKIVVEMDEKEINQIVQSEIRLDIGNINIDDILEISPLLVKLSKLRNLKAKIESMNKGIIDISDDLTKLSEGL